MADRTTEAARECRPARPAPHPLREHSGRGNRYMSGWLGKASVVAFAGEPDKHGNPTWDLFVSTPEPRAETNPNSLLSSDPAGAPAKHDARQRPEAVAQRSPARRQERGDGWRGSQYRRPVSGAQRAPAAGGG